MMSGTTEQKAHVLVDFPLYLLGPGRKSYCGNGENGMLLTSRQYCKKQPKSVMFGARLPGYQVFYGGALCVWVLSAELASHLLPGTQNFGIDPRLMENCAPLV